MGSIKYRRPQDRIVLGNIRQTFHDIVEELDPLIASSARGQRLKSAIIEELIDLASNGKPHEIRGDQALVVARQVNSAGARVSGRLLCLRNACSIRARSNVAVVVWKSSRLSSLART